MILIQVEEMNEWFEQSSNKQKKILVYLPHTQTQQKHFQNFKVRINYESHKHYLFFKTKWSLTYHSKIGIPVFGNNHA